MAILPDTRPLTVHALSAFRPSPTHRPARASLGFTYPGSDRVVFGDRENDVLAVTGTGDLLLYRGNGRGGWASSGQKIGRGWDSFR